MWHDVVFNGAAIDQWKKVSIPSDHCHSDICYSILLVQWVRCCRMSGAFLTNLRKREDRYYILTQARRLGNNEIFTHLFKMVECDIKSFSMSGACKRIKIAHSPWTLSLALVSINPPTLVKGGRCYHKVGISGIKHPTKAEGRNKA